MSDSTGNNPQRANTSRQTEYYNTDPYSAIKVSVLCDLQEKHLEYKDMDRR